MVSLPSIGKSEDFLLVLVNRPLLVLHSEVGYVGLGCDLKHLEGNCVSYIPSSLSLTEEGYYNFLIGQYISWLFVGMGKLTVFLADQSLPSKREEIFGASA